MTRGWPHEITDHAEALVVSLIDTTYAHASAPLFDGPATIAAVDAHAALRAYIVALESRCTTTTLEEIQCATR